MEILSTGPVHDFGVFRVKRLVARAPRSDQDLEYHIIERPDSVQIIAITVEDQMILVEQERHGTQRSSLEFVAGLLEDGEDPRTGAQRELEEETGYQAKHWEELGWYYADPAILTNKVTVLLATGCARTGEKDQDEGEDVKLRLASEADVARFFTDGTIRHGLVFAAWQLFQSRVQRSRSRT